jgi:beta-lactam-binding protein with PASTA domain
MPFSFLNLVGGLAATAQLEGISDEDRRRAAFVSALLPVPLIPAVVLTRAMLPPSPPPSAPPTETPPPADSSLRQVPDVRHVKVPQAQEILGQLGLKTEIVNVENFDFKREFILEQLPKPGTFVSADSAVTLFVSNGFSAPDVRNKSVADAKVQLQRFHLVAVSDRSDFDNVIEEGHIISQDPASGAKVFNGDEVRLTVSKGPQPEEPSVGGDQAAAMQEEVTR